MSQVQIRFMLLKKNLETSTLHYASYLYIYGLPWDQLVIQWLLWKCVVLVPCSFSCRSQSLPASSGLPCLATCCQALHPWDKSENIHTGYFQHFKQVRSPVETMKGLLDVWMRPVNEAHGVDAVQCQHNLSSVETSPLLRHIIVAHQVDQVSSWHILHHHVEVAVVLECIKQLDDKKKKKLHHTQEYSKMFQENIFKKIHKLKTW